MVKVFVHASQKNGNPLIADSYDFEIVPREGEHIVVVEGDKEFVLKVLSVTHIAALKGKILAPVSAVTIHAEIVE